MHTPALTRRAFLKLTATAPLSVTFGQVSQRGQRGRIPVGLQLYTLRDQEEKDRMATLQAVAGMGYEGVEFWGPYVEWTTDYAKEVRKRLDSLGLRCFSTHTRRPYFSAENFSRAIELNQILGSRYVVMAHSEKVDGFDGWKQLAVTLTQAHERLRPLGLRAAFHNYPSDFRPLGDTRPIDILAANTPRDFAFQLDTVMMSAGADPVAFVKANPGRVKSYHLKDWSPGEGGGRVLLGEGIGPWKALFEAAESVGGVEYYLIEQEGSRFVPMETAKRCLENYRSLRAS
jgi:sugar phosphate isomerase/epimerase